MSTTIPEVRAICAVAQSLTDAQVQALIDFATSLTSEWLVGSGYSTVILNAIDRFLAAHFMVLAYDQGGLVRKSTGSSEEQYRELSNDAAGLGSTIYGQQALALDLNGILSAMSTKSNTKAQFRVI